MSDDRKKLIHILNSLDADYREGRISRGKYEYFRTKYEDKLNSIDALEASMRIRSMQGKTDPSKRNRKRKRPANDKKRQEEDLVQKYIINPKKGDSAYNKKKSSMDSGTFKLVLILVLVIGFTAGIAYGVFNSDFESVSETAAVGIVEDTAFPEITVVLNNTTTTYNTTNITKIDKNATSDDDDEDDEDIETTTDKSSDKKKKSSSSSKKSSSSSKKKSSGSTPSGDSGGRSSTPSADTGGGDSGSDDE